jgi:hypothetical protein
VKTFSRYLIVRYHLFRKTWVVSELEISSLRVELTFLDQFLFISFQVAVDADDKNFVGQPCCDQLLGNIWYNKIDSARTDTLKRLRLLLSICTFGLLAPAIIQFREKASESDRSHKDQIKDYEMTVNETEAEKKELLPRTTQR